MIISNVQRVIIYSELFQARLKIAKGAIASRANNQLRLILIILTNKKSLSKLVVIFYLRVKNCLFITNNYILNDK